MAIAPALPVVDRGALLADGARRGQTSTAPVRTVAVGSRRVCNLAAVALALGAVAYWGSAAEHSSVRSAPASHERLSSLPFSAQGSISQAVGASSPAYMVSARGKGFHATNPSQRLQVRF